MDLYNNFCKKLADSMDYSNIKRNDELYNLLIKAVKNMKFVF